MNRIQKVPVSDVFETNSYFYIDEKTGHGFLIDPGAEAGKLLREVEQNDWTIEKILLTHGHFDHTGAVREISEKLRIPYLIHGNGKLFLMDTRYNLSAYCDRDIHLEGAEYIEDGEMIRSEANQDFCLQVLHTPGHTPDSVVFYNRADGVAFVGDTIFRGSIGNTGYPGGSRENLMESIAHRIFRLPAETILYSGHSDPTSVGSEIKRYT